VALTGEQFPIQAGDFSAVVVEVGAGLRRLALNDEPLTCTYADDELPPKAVGLVLVPWPNRIRDGRYSFDGQRYQLPLTDPAHAAAIHGLGRWARWNAVEHTDTSVTLALGIVPQTGYPFEVRAEVTYRLDPATGLQVTASAQNVGRRPAPFGAGFHPYVSTRGARLDDVQLQLPAETHILLDDRGLPTGETEPVDGTDRDFRSGRRLGQLRLDDAFTGLRREGGVTTVTVRGPRGGAQIWCDGAFGYLQAFTLDDLGNGETGAAIEPMTCPADAFNSGEGLIVLQPNDRWEGSWGIRPL
jgi:aldose 1-epimerase